MQKRLAFWLITILLISIITIGLGNSKSMISTLTGYIDTVSNWHIERINLPSLKTEIDRIGQDYLVNDFDTSRDGEDRIVVSANPNSAVLLKYSSNQTIKPILEKKTSLKSPSLSPDGKNIAYLVAEKQRQPEKHYKLADNWNLYLVSSTGVDDRQIFKLPVARFKPSWFPDGERLAVSTTDLKIYIIDSTTCSGKKIIDFGYAPTVSNDGKKIAYLSHDVKDPIKKKIVEFSKLTYEQYDKMRKSGGKEFTELTEMESYSLKHEIYIFDIETGKSKKLTQEEWIEEPAVWSPDDKYLVYNDRRAVINDIFVINVNTGEQVKIPGVEGRVMSWLP